jgi:hypothetical protein
MRHSGSVPEQQVYRYSGATTDDPAAIRPVLARSRSVRVTHGGALGYAVDPAADVLADETEKYVSVLSRDAGTTVDDAAQVAELVAAVTVDLVSDINCMCSGDLAVEFFDVERKLIAVLTIDMPDSLTWPLWPGAARVVDPDRLQSWLARHGVWSARRYRKSRSVWW